jgi:pimeloyl-ACP methyl ester carboxylesterase
MTLPIRNSRIRLTQGQLFWREVGQGKTLVLLHGAWNTGDQWLAAIEPLSRSYHCVAPDLLGFGESECPNLHYSIEQQVECLAEYLEVLKLRQVYLVGESVGGWIAATYALRFPDQVKGLVLITPEGVLSPFQSWRWQRWLSGQLPVAYWLLRSILPVARLFGRDRRIAALLQRRQQLRQSPVACNLLFGRRRAEIQAEVLDQRLQWLKLPLLLLQGTETARAAAVAQALTQQAAQTQISQLAGSSSELLTTHAIEVAAQIHEFVQSID